MNRYLSEWTSNHQTVLTYSLFQLISLFLFVSKCPFWLRCHIREAGGLLKKDKHFLCSPPIASAVTFAYKLPGDTWFSQSPRDIDARFDREEIGRQWAILLREEVSGSHRHCLSRLGTGNSPENRDPEERSQAAKTRLLLGQFFAPLTTAIVHQCRLSKAEDKRKDLGAGTHLGWSFR